MKKTLLPFLAIAGLSSSANAAHIWINEFHYDNDLGDVGEFVEVVVTDEMPTVLTDIVFSLYNGNGGAPYGTDVNLSEFTVGDTIAIVGTGFSATFYSYSYPANGIQNGAPDGFALSNSNTAAVIQFLSYEGSLTAVGGPADGMTSVDIGAAEPGSAPVGSSVSLTGSATEASGFTWTYVDSGATPGSVNAGQTFAVPEPGITLLVSLGGFALIFRRRRLA